MVVRRVSVQLRPPSRPPAELSPVHTVVDTKLAWKGDRAHCRSGGTLQQRLHAISLPLGSERILPTSSPVGFKEKTPG